MDNWDDLKFLLAVHRLGTMTRAAKALNSTVGTVSRRIERLTNELGTAPFVKVGGVWQPSEAILPLLEIAESFEESLKARSNQEQENLAAKTPVTLRIGCPPVVASQVLFPQLRADGAPPEHVSLEFHERFGLNGIGDCDIVIQLGAPTEGRIVTRKVGDLVFQLARHRNGGAARGWVGLSEDHAVYPPSRQCNAYFSEPPRVVVDTYEHVLRVILETETAGAVPETMLRHHQELIPLKTEQTVAEFWLLFHESRRHDPVVHDAVDWICQCFQEIKRQRLQHGS